MFNLIRTHIKIMFSQKGAKIAFYFITLCVVINYVNNLYNFKDVDRTCLNNFVEYSLLSGNNAIGWSVVSLLLFILVLPSGMSFGIDKKYSMDNHFIIRSKGKYRYITSKIIASFVVTFFCIFFPLIVELVLNICAFPMEASEKMVAISNILKIDDGEVFKTDMFLYKEFLYNPIMYSLIRSTLLATLCALLTILPIPFSCICNKYLSYLFIPVYFLLELYSFTCFKVFDHKVVHNFNSYVVWGYSSITNESFIWFYVLVCIITILSIVFTYFYESKKEV